MKILITGAKGQLGKKLIDKLSTINYKLILTDTAEMDITDKRMVEEVVSKEKPDFIIHAAAYTQVDKAENEARELCYKVNAQGTKNLAEVAKAKDTTLLYISTDYVFPGNGNVPLTENDATDPVNYYGQTKLDGENFIRSICEKYYIIRTAWLYGELPKGHPGSNFVGTMLKLAKEKEELTVVDDQIGSPTYTGDLVNVISEIISRITRPIVSFPPLSVIPAKAGIQTRDKFRHVIRNGDDSNLTIQQFNNNPLPYGIYHATGEGEASWYDFAKEIFKQTKTKAKLIPTTSDHFIRPARRPAYSYLSKAKLNKSGITIRPWQKALREYLKNR